MLTSSLDSESLDRCWLRGGWLGAVLWVVGGTAGGLWTASAPRYLVRGRLVGCWGRKAHDTARR